MPVAEIDDRASITVLCAKILGSDVQRVNELCPRAYPHGRAVEVDETPLDILSVQASRLSLAHYLVEVDTYAVRPCIEATQSEPIAVLRAYVDHTEPRAIYVKPYVWILLFHWSKY